MTTTREASCSSSSADAQGKILLASLGDSQGKILLAYLGLEEVAKAKACRAIVTLGGHRDRLISRAAEENAILDVPISFSFQPCLVACFFLWGDRKSFVLAPNS